MREEEVAPRRVGKPLLPAQPWPAKSKLGSLLRSDSIEEGVTQGDSHRGTRPWRGGGGQLAAVDGDGLEQQQRMDIDWK